MMKKIIIVFLLGLLTGSVNAQLKVTFPAKDGLMITADWYPVNSDKPIILLCHKSQSSRGEYSEIALRLNKFGFNCLAVDLRSGYESHGVVNETVKDAAAKGLSNNMEDAEQDMATAIDYLYDKYQKNVIILGSSFSASLALKIAVENYKVSSVAAFSPGEYFSDPTLIRNSIAKLLKPVFITSNSAEAEQVTDLVKDVNSRIKVQYIPSSKGDNGSTVLTSEYPYNQEYWIALMSFLNKMKKIG